jgi:hypothetical protein
MKTSHASRCPGSNRQLTGAARGDARFDDRDLSLSLTSLGTERSDPRQHRLTADSAHAFENG